MTTDLLANDGPARRPSAGRIGALAGVTPIVMVGAWIAFSGWGGTASELLLAGAQIALGAVIAGWIVGGRLGRSIPARLIGLAAYGLVARLVILPLNVVGSVWEERRAGQVSEPLGIVIAAGGYLLYGLVSSVYTVVFLLPFGAGWLVTFLLLRRAFER